MTPIETFVLLLGAALVAYWIQQAIAENWDLDERLFRWSEKIGRKLK